MIFSSSFVLCVCVHELKKESTMAIGYTVEGSVSVMKGLCDRKETRACAYVMPIPHVDAVTEFMKAYSPGVHLSCQALPNDSEMVIVTFYRNCDC